MRACRPRFIVVIARAAKPHGRKGPLQESLRRAAEALNAAPASFTPRGHSRENLTVSEPGVSNGTKRASSRRNGKRLASGMAPCNHHSHRRTIRRDHRGSGRSYVAKCRNRGIQPATLNKYLTFIKQLRAYCDARGYVFIDQLGIADMDRFYALLKDRKRAKAKKLERLKSFVQFCLKREWLSKDIGEDLEAPEGSSIPAHKSPFTDAELERIFSVCDQLRPLPPGPRSPGVERRRCERFHSALHLHRPAHLGRGDVRHHKAPERQ